MEVYDDDELVEDPVDEKKMVEKETAWKVTRKRKAKGKGSYWGDEYRECLLGDQVNISN